MSIKTKRIVTGLLAGIIVIAMALSIVTPAFAADDLDGLKQQGEDLQQKAGEAEAIKNATQEELAAAQGQVDELMAEMEIINQEISEVGNKIIDLNRKIQDNEKKLEEKEAELAQAQEDLQVYYAALKDRIQMMYESDRSSYLEVLLNVSSISEFFSKLEYISQMVEYDNQIMEELDQCRQTIQTSKEEIETTKSELEADRSEEQKEQEALETVQAQKQQKLDGVQSNQLALELLAQQQEAEEAQILAAIESNQAAIQNEEERIAAEQAKQAQQQAQQNEQNQPSGGGSSETGGGSSEGGSSNNGGYDDGGSSSGGNTPSGGGSSGGGDIGGSDGDRALANGWWSTWLGIGNGMLGWPVDCYILSSLYGPRIHPITGEYRTHSGIDFPAGYGSPIYAAASGKVISVIPNNDGSGYGNYVLIAHDNGLSTLYAHCSSLAVSEGERVSAGQVIAYVGSTGNSTGSHLHFEVYNGSSRVNPEDYL